MLEKIKQRKRLAKIIALANQGHSCSYIAKRFRVTKQRIAQILKRENINPLIIRRIKNNELFEKLIVSVKESLLSGLSVSEVRVKHNLTPVDIPKLFKSGVDVRKIRPEGIIERDKKCFSLYKKGLTAYEIIDALPEVQTVNNVYRHVCDVNNGKLPKRISTRQKKSIKLKREIRRLKKQHTFIDVHSKLVEKGFKNLNGYPLKLEAVMHLYYAKK